MHLVKKWWGLPWWASGKKTLCFHCRGHRFNPWSGNKDSPPPCHMAWTKKNFNKKQIMNHKWEVCVFLCVCARTLSHIQLFETAWTVAGHAALSMEFP